MKYLSCILFVLILLLEVHVNAQQDPHFGLYRYNMSVLNPGYAGSNGRLEGIFGVRSQWVGIDGGPETYNFNINSPIPIMKNVGMGISIVGDDVFVLSETHLYADFSYRLQIYEGGYLYAGIKGGVSLLKVDLDELKIMGDPLFTNNVSTTNPNVGVGLYMKGDRYYISVSAPGLLKNDRYEKKGVVPVSATDNIHFFAGGGYDFSLSDSFLLKPSTLAKFVTGSPISIDATVSVEYKERIELGANYRIDESFAGFITVGFLEHLRFGYLFEKTTTDVGNYENGTHEVVLKIMFGNKKENKIEEAIEEETDEKL